jgi:hypothetical protein
MNCQDARLRIGAQPEAMSEELAGHLRECAACSGFRDEMLALESRIRRALELPPQLRHASTAVERRRPGIWAMAASLLMAVGLLIWALRPGETLAGDIVSHVADEPSSWSRSEPVSEPVLDDVARRAGIEIDAADGSVVYVQSCPFRGYTVPHLVVATTRGPVTVMVLREESIDSPQRFAEEGYSGILVPSAQGALAVLMRGEADIEAAAREIQALIRPARTR